MTNGSWIVLFICTYESGSNRIAEAFFNRYAPPYIRALAAGELPAEKLNPFIVSTMRESGIDIGCQRLRTLTPDLLDDAKMVIVIGRGRNGAVTAVFVPAAIWELDDPEGQPVEKIRQIRDVIEARVKLLIQKNLIQSGSSQSLRHIGYTYADAMISSAHQRRCMGTAVD